MKNHSLKALLYTLTLLLFSITTYSQDNWTWLNPKPMGYTFYGSAVIPSSSTLMAVGTKGVVAKTTDSGSSWILIRTDSTSILNSVHFPTSTIGYACGTNSTLLKTTNGGETWTSLTPPLPGIVFTQIQFTDSQIGFLLDKINFRLYKTTDGGSVWEVYVNENTYGYFNSFYMIDGNNGFIATDDGSVGKITAGVSNFSNITSSSLKVIRFYNSQQGVAMGQSLVKMTTNGGTSWASASSPPSIIPNAVEYSSSQKLVAVSSSEDISYSTDGGNTWTTPAPEGTVSLNSITFYNENNGILLGASGNLYTTTNGGVSWTKSTTYYTPVTSALNSVQSYNGTNIWAAGGEGRIIKSTDAGSTWTTLNYPTASTINDIDFLSDSRGWVVISTGVYLTTNGGTNWTNPLATSAGTQELAFASYTRGFVCGSQGLVRYSTNGSGWATPSTLPSGAYFGISITSDTTIAFICGSYSGKSRLIKTTDGGNNWVAQANAEISGITFYSVNFPTTTTGWAVGTGGNIYKTTNGGTNWVRQTSNTSGILQSVRFYDENHGVAVGNDGTIIKTTDGGTNWIRAKEVSEQSIMCALVLSETTTIVVCNAGTILKSSNAPLPVELTSFTASVKNNSVHLNWETATEVDNYGFDIERKDKNSTWTKIGFIEGHFTSNSPKYYTFSDNPSGSTKFSYRLKQIDNDGKFEYSGIVEVDLTGMLPKDIEIKNFPNPFNPATNLNMRLPETAKTTIELYNSTGEKIRTLYEGILESGITWAHKLDGSNLPSGIYLVYVSAGKYRKTHKILLMK